MKVKAKLLSLLLLLALCISALPVYAVEGMNDGNCVTLDVLPTAPFQSGVSPYDGTTVVYTQTEAQSAGVPVGYSDGVTRVGPGSNTSYSGITIDPSALKIPVDAIESITFRVYLAGGTSLRISNKGASNWAVLATIASNTWVDYTIKADGAGFNSSGQNISYFANDEGNLGIFGMGAKNVTAMYIDSIKITLSDDYDISKLDVTPPVITYSGSLYVSLQDNEEFVPGEVSAYDEYDDESVAVRGEWSDGAMDVNGNLKVGIHTYTFFAEDKTGNVAALAVTVEVDRYDSSVIKIEDVPHIPHDINIANDTSYKSVVTELTSDEAGAKGLPAGYKGTVYEIAKDNNTSYIGVCIDLSSYEIPINLVESISFNVLMPTNYSELRMRCGNTTDWVMRCSSAPTGGWNTVVLNASGLNFYGSSKMTTLANEDGNLGAFALIGRNNGTYAPYYIDSITIKLKDDDKVAPVLNYLGETDILTSAGKAFVPGITAYDEQESRVVDVEYTWSAGAVDGDGNMIEGAHTCRVSATDYFGNTSYIDLNVTVGPPDVTAPTIGFSASTIYVPVGTYYRIAIVAVDDYDDVDVVEEWSAGAIDRGGRLAEGVHTLTLTSTDLSGNTSVHVVTVYVVNGDSTVGTIIECGK